MPSDGRRIRRVSYFEKDLPPVQISFGGKLRSVTGQIRDLSSTGIGVSVLASELPMKLEDIGDKRRCRISMEIGENRNTVSGVIQRCRTELVSGKSYILLGIEFEKVYTDKGALQNGRFVQLQRNAQPLVYSQDALQADEKIVLRLVGIASDRIILKTSKSNRTLVPGQLLTLSIAVPGLMDEPIEGRVEEIEFASAQDSEYSLHLFVMKRSRRVIKRIAEYFISFADDADTQAMKAIGWSTKVRGGVDLSLTQRLMRKVREIFASIFKRR